MLSSNQTYSLAHTAQCKLKMSADSPDRNLRFVLGHAFTFDKIMCRIVEIEDEENRTKSIQKNQLNEAPGRRVSFSDNSNRPSGDLRGVTQVQHRKGRAPSPPPDTGVVHGDSDTSSDEDDAFEDEDDDPSLSLTRTISARPPPGLITDGDESDDEVEPTSPPMPSSDILATVTRGDGDEEIAGLYESVRNCGCQSHEDGKTAPPIKSFWKLPAQEGKGSQRIGLVQIQA